MKKLIYFLAFCSLLCSPSLIQAQEDNEEILTIMIRWLPGDKSQVYINAIGKQTEQFNLEGSLTYDKKINETAFALNELLNKYTEKGWSLVTAFTMFDGTVHYFIFKK